MNFLSCDGSITADSTSRPVCSGGWLVLSPDQMKSALEISGSNFQSQYTPEDYSYFEDQIVFILIVAFGFRELKKLINPKS